MFIYSVSFECSCAEHSIKLLLSAADSLLTALDEVNNAYRNTLCSQFKALPWGWNYHSFWNDSVTPRAKLPFFLEWHRHPEGNGMLFYNLTLSPRGQRSNFYNLTLSPRGQRSNFYNLTLSPRGQCSNFYNMTLSPRGQRSIFYNLTLSPRGQRFNFYNLTLSPRGQRSNFYNMTLSPRGQRCVFYNITLQPPGRRSKIFWNDTFAPMTMPRGNDRM